MLNKYYCWISKLEVVFAAPPFLEFPRTTNINIENRVIDIIEIVDNIETLNQIKISGLITIRHRKLNICPPLPSLPQKKATPSNCVLTNYSGNSYTQQLEDWNVKGVFKQRKTSLPYNYWPISFTRWCGKIMETVAYKYGYNVLRRITLINEYQSDFLPQRQLCTDYCKYIIVF